MFARIVEAFGTADLVTGLFFRFDNALRFDLGGGTAAVSDPARFSQALDRSRSVLLTLFSRPETVRLLVFMFEDAAEERTPDPEILASLPECGLDPTALRRLGSTSSADASAGDAAFRHCYLYDRPLDAVDVTRALWGAIARETPVRPRLVGALPVFVDFDQRLLAHVYDDRLMDVVAMDGAALKAVHQLHKDWIADGCVKFA